MSVVKSSTISIYIDGYDRALSGIGSIGEEVLPSPIASTSKKQKESILEEENGHIEDSLDADNDSHNSKPEIMDETGANKEIE